MRPSLVNAANLAVIALVVYAMGRPEGPIGARLLEWSKHRSLIERTFSDWPTLAMGAKLDTGGSEVRVVEFSEYQCPFCRRQHKALAALARSGGVPGVVFRHLPLPIHPAAEGAARSAICAEQQGRFLALHDRLMTTQQWMNDTNWVREATAVGVSDTVAFLACLSDSSTTDRLRRDASLARELGINGTPTFLFRGGRHDGMMPDTMVLRLGRSEGRVK